MNIRQNYLNKHNVASKFVAYAFIHTHTTINNIMYAFMLPSSLLPVACHTSTTCIFHY